MLFKSFYAARPVLPFNGTDLACEAWDGGEGSSYSEEVVATNDGMVRIERMQIVTEGAAKRLCHRRGRYITITLPCSLAVLGTESCRNVGDLLSCELIKLTCELCGRPPDGNFDVIAAGLGNSDMTADAIGPNTAARISPTRHLRELDGDLYCALGCSAVSVISPGVIGRTGIESADVLRGAIATVRPDLLVVVDALAARSCDRLGRTVQLTDSGITPGSGVDNTRGALTYKTLGVPIISIGVPTVVGSSTLIFDALLEAGMVNSDYCALPPKLKAVLDNRQSFFVSPQDADLINSVASDIISRAINSAFGVIE